MDSKTLQEHAPKQLERVLAFFARVEAKASLVFAVDSALLGVLAVNLRKQDLSDPIAMGLFAGAIVLFGASLFYVYRCSFPDLKGGHSSLIYFNEVSKLREQEYVKSFRGMSTEEFLDDVLSQAWRNSQILTKKFAAIKTAFILTALGLAPWIGFLILASLRHPELPAVK
jgi:hypothetical protein